MFLTKKVNDKSLSTHHKLMLEAGMIHQVMAGVYMLLPLGLKAISNLQALCRRHMVGIGCQEVSMPALLPLEYLHKSGRYDSFGESLFTVNKDFYLAPTHEEVITACLKHLLQSYKQLPLHILQFQTKFRNELRPRDGLMRCREFMMQDSYSFHLNQACSDATYQITRQAYKQIFKALELEAIIVEADASAMKGRYSEEFHVVDEAGEDLIFISSNGNYNANKEVARYNPSALKQDLVIDSSLVFTTTINSQKEKVVLVTCPEHEINLLKVENFINSALEPAVYPWRAAEKFIVDHSAARLTEFTIASEDDRKFSWEELPNRLESDIRYAVHGDPAPDGGLLMIKRGIEVAHIFNLGTYYSDKMDFKIHNSVNVRQNVIMNCYGIGISRLLAVCIKHHSAANAIQWPKSIAPCQVAVVLGKGIQDKHAALIDNLLSRLKIYCPELTIVTNTYDNLRTTVQHCLLTGHKAVVVADSFREQCRFTVEGDGILGSFSQQQIPDLVKLVGSLF